MKGWIIAVMKGWIDSNERINWWIIEVMKGWIDELMN